MLKFNTKKFDIAYTLILALIFIFAFYLRFKLFILNPGQHHDESNLALNLIDGSFIDMFKPLSRLQTAPPLFLVISKFIYKLVNLNYTAEFSDTLLKVFPFICGITAVPLFTKLLDSLFKNKFINISGTLILALNSYAVYYSCVFKQYSLEMLVSIILLLTITNINFEDKYFKKNLILFTLIGFAPLISLSSYFILVGIFLYLGYLFIKTKSTNYLKYIFAIMLSLILCSLFIILPLSLTHSAGMHDFWQNYFKLNFKDFITKFLEIDARTYCIKFNYNIIWIYVLLLLTATLFNKKIFLTISIPFIVLYTAVYFSFYPGAGRLLLFAYPLFIIIMLFPLSIIKVLPKKIVTTNLSIILIILLLPKLYNLPNTEYFVLKPDRAGASLQYLSKHYDNSSTVLISGSSNSYKYYLKFYNIKNYLFINEDDWQTKFEKLPSGTYYVLSGYSKTRAKDIYEYILANTKRLEHKRFIHKNNNNFGYYIKFQK